jgi:tRNA A37 methylthiotransferase MiaB
LLRDMERQGEIKIPERMASFIRQFLETREDIIEFTNQLVGSLGETNELFMATSDFFSDAEGEQIPEEYPESLND